MYIYVYIHIILLVIHLSLVSESSPTHQTNLGQHMTVGLRLTDQQSDGLNRRLMNIVDNNFTKVLKQTLECAAQ